MAAEAKHSSSSCELEPRLARSGRRENQRSDRREFEYLQLTAVKEEAGYEAAGEDG